MLKITKSKSQLNTCREQSYSKHKQKQLQIVNKNSNANRVQIQNGQGPLVHLKKVALFSEIESMITNNLTNSVANIQFQHGQIQKLSIVHRSITTIDKPTLSSRLPLLNLGSSLKFLYLSNNLISNIQHIQQFTNLQTLSLTYNQIEKLNNIRYLGKLTKLTHVGMQGNPVCASPVYFCCILGVLHNSHILQRGTDLNVVSMVKIIDRQQITVAMMKEQVHNWDVYEQSIKDLLLNYVRLMYLVQFGRKQAVHRVIVFAAAKIANSSHSQFRQSSLNQQVHRQQGYQVSNCYLQTAQLQKRLNFYIKQAQTDIQDLPVKYLMNLQSTIYQDIKRIWMKKNQQSIKIEQYGKQNKKCNSHNNSFILVRQQVEKYKNSRRRKQKNDMETFISSMYELLQKQKQKLDELKEIILNKYANDSDKNKEHNQFLPNPLLSSSQQKDIQQIQQILSTVLRPRLSILPNGAHPQQYRASKQQLYYQWKLLHKIFIKFKQYSRVQSAHKYSVVTIARIINLAAIDSKASALTKIQQHGRKVIISKMNTILCKLKIYNVSLGFKAIFGYSSHILKQQMQNKKYQQMQEQKVNRFKTILKNKQILKKNFNYWKQYIFILKITQQNSRLNQQAKIHQLKQQKMSNKLALLQKLLQITEQKLKQKQNNAKSLNSPRLLLRQLQRDFQLINTEPIKSGCASPKAIRRNKITRQKQNNADDHKLGSQLVYQRKFNSSRKALKIDNNQ